MHASTASGAIRIGEGKGDRIAAARLCGVHRCIRLVHDAIDVFRPTDEQVDADTRRTLVFDECARSMLTTGFNRKRFQ